MSTQTRDLLADPFATVSTSQILAALTKEPRRFGQPMGNKRYHMPLLPGEVGTKSVPAGVQPWVPGGIMRTTNLTSAISDQEALMIWELEQFAIGIVRDHTLCEELHLLIQQGDRDGVNWQRLDLHPEVRKALTGEWRDRGSSITGRAKQAAGGNGARQAGIHRHTAWERRAKTGDMDGTEDMRSQLLALEELLAVQHLERVPELCERTVRNVAVGCAGRFDDVVRSTCAPDCEQHPDRQPGQLFMADLKTKRRRFWTLLEVRAQLAIYARSEHMLELDDPEGLTAHYVPGPVHHVDQDRGWILCAPSDGAPPYLYRADLRAGWNTALLARQVVDDRSAAKSAAAFADAEVK